MAEQDPERFPDVRADDPNAANQHGTDIAEHGGNIGAAARRWNIPEDQWLDLSTGISPFPCPLPRIDREVWRRLPDGDKALHEAAASYYGTTELMAVPGSQAAIQLLPKILFSSSRKCTVAIVSPTYSEHPAAWRAAGHELRPIEASGAFQAASDPGTDVLLLCNPNNPTGERWSAEELLALHARLAARGAWLVVDEAFVDATPELSLAVHIDKAAGKPGLVILRSMGKFFGLAGARVGFVLAPGSVRERMAAALGPWAVAGPSQVAATHALGNSKFHDRARKQLAVASRRLVSELKSHGFEVSGATHYFAWARHPEARRIQEHFARSGILIRAFDDPTAFRIGLPGNAAQWRRFIEALKHAA